MLNYNDLKQYIHVFFYFINWACVVFFTYSNTEGAHKQRDWVLQMIQINVWLKKVTKYIISSTFHTLPHCTLT